MNYGSYFVNIKKFLGIYFIFIIFSCEKAKHLNEEQKIAVLNIKNGHSGIPFYLLIGPPGI